MQFPATIIKNENTAATTPQQYFLLSLTEI